MKIILIFILLFEVLSAQSYPVITGAPELYLCILNGEDAFTTYEYNLEPISQIYTFNLSATPNEVMIECNSNCEAGYEQDGVTTNADKTVYPSNQQG